MAPSRGQVTGSQKSKSDNPKQKPKQGKHVASQRSTKPTHDDTSSAQQLLPQITRPRQQRLLSTFVSAFPDLFDPTGPSQSLVTTLQEVKQHLYNRDFQIAFGRPGYLDVYAARWSPSRALGYLEIFRDVFAKYVVRTWSDSGDVSGDRLGEITTDFDRNGNSESSTTPLNILCLGGGAGAEVTALNALYQLLNQDHGTSTIPSFSISAIDMADWSSVLHRLGNSTDDGVATSFTQQDLLSPNISVPDVVRSVSSDPQTSCLSSMLVTLLFTLNELYTTSLPRTQTLLLELTRALSTGALLLVVDSPGSYSTVKLGGKEATYPMRWLLDHTLLKAAAEVDDEAADDGGKTRMSAKWEKVEEVESKWFRVPDGLSYPIELENMRYQMHLFRRL